LYGKDLWKREAGGFEKPAYVVIAVIRHDSEYQNLR